MNLNVCRSISLALLGIMSFSYVLGQSVLQQLDNKQVSPEVAAFGKFVDMPVSRHTGIPDISIPIYNLRVGKLTVPIDLKYHLSGHRVDEVASQVGLGWTLGAGGVVTQDIQGLNDNLSNYGWLNSNIPIPQTGLMKEKFEVGENIFEGAQWYQFNVSIIDKQLDSQPDIFNYTLPTSSGKFYFSQAKQAYFMPFTNNAVSYQGNAAGFTSFTITDDAGIAYYFSSREMIAYETASTCSDREWGEGAYSYFLDKITSPTGEYIDFLYEPITYSYKGQRSESRANRVEGNNGCPVILPCHSDITNFVSTVRVKEIKTSAGDRAVFTYSTANRTDLPGTNALAKITIHNSSRQLHAFDFNYSYFQASVTSADPTLNSRLKLLSLTKNGTETYRFDYNVTELPHRLSYRQDHWGYYNGTKNSTTNTLLPIDLRNGFASGAYRDTDPVYKTASVLEKIHYPTGGTTSFVTESNEIRYNGNLSTTVQKNARTVPSSQEMTIVPFSVSSSGGNFTLQWRISNLVPNSSVILERQGAVIGTYTGNSNGIISINTLQPGNYQIRYTYMSDPSDLSTDFFNINWVENQLEEIAENRFTGGLRIKQIIFDPLIPNQAYTKNFVYNTKGTSWSSGKTIYDPYYVYFRYMNRQDGGAFAVCKYVQQSSSSVAPLTLLFGGSVAYNYVEEHVSSRQSTGYKSFAYMNEGVVPTVPEDLTITGLKFPFAPRTINSWLNGVLTETNEYSYLPSINDYILKQKVEYKYAQEIGNGANEHFVRGAKVGAVYPRMIIDDTQYPYAFGIDYYYLYSSWFRPTEEKHTMYDGETPTSKTMLYHYDNALHGQISRKQMQLSNGASFTSYTLYPQDYAAGTGFIDQMRTRRLLSYPIETVDFQHTGTNYFATKGEVYQYNSTGLLTDIYNLDLRQAIPLASFKRSNMAIGNTSFTGSIQSFAADTRYILSLRFLSYDRFGNPVEIKKQEAPLTVYLWGYGGQYPIAKIENASYAEVLGILGQAAITSLEALNVSESTINTHIQNLRNTLTKSQVTTYTYSPLTGMKSMTDPRGQTEYYEYDGFQRLKEVLDFDRNVLTDYQYNYKP